MLDRLLGRKKEWRSDELLSAYLDDELDAEEQAWLEQQLATDPALRTDLETLQQTVSLLNDLPQAPVPRNFILPPTIDRRPQAARPDRSKAARPAWVAPLFTATTALVALAFGVVLSLDLMFVGAHPGARQFASAPESEPMPAAEAPSVAPAASPEVSAAIEEPLIAEAERVELTREVEMDAEIGSEAEVEALPTDTTTPTSMMLGAPNEEAEDLAESVAATPAETLEATAPKAAGSAPVEDDIAATPEMAQEWEEPPPPALETTEPEIVETEMAESGPRVNWFALEITLGLIVVGLLLATIWAWRAPH
jgi:anti-sigma factor RsiW